MYRNSFLQSNIFIKTVFDCNDLIILIIRYSNKCYDRYKIQQNMWVKGI